ncbi:MAG: DUF2993 domain-containing protein [Cyanobacteria bacterium P01_G01_bin.19]
MITRLLSTALKFYLRSQVDQVRGLQLKIDGKNRQVLQGCIPRVCLSCEDVVYQDLQLGVVEIVGSNIAVNLPEILKNKPLRLLEPIVVEIKLILDADNLSNSIDSSLLQSGLTDLWQIFVAEQLKNAVEPMLAESDIEWQKIAIAPSLNHNLSITEGELTFAGVYQDSSGNLQKLVLSAGIGLANSHALLLSPVKITDNTDFTGELIERLEIDLGKDVEIEELKIESEKLQCCGKIKIAN